MSDFYKKFLVEDVPRPTPGTGKQVFLAAFGKHPGWDDHVEDLGLETGSLIATKMLLYVKGIGGEIDAGAWEKLDASQVLPVFRHIFIWQRGNQAIIGRLWASSDGKGRTRYPMVVCAHCVGVPLNWALELVLPRLEQLETVCVTTPSAAEVRAALDRTRAELREGVARSPDTGTIAHGPAMRDRFLRSPQFGEGQEGLLRVLYQVSSQFAPFAPGKFNPRADAARLRPQHMRAPWGTESPEVAVLLWSQLLQAQIDAAVPLLLLVPLQDRWIDVTVGEPTREEFFCLRATPKALPLVSEVPYNMDDAFRQAARAALDAFVQGQKVAGVRRADTSTVAPVENGEKANSAVGRLWKWIGGAGVVILAGMLAFSALRRGGDSGRGPGAPPPEPPPSAVTPQVAGSTRTSEPVPADAADRGKAPPPAAGASATAAAESATALDAERRKAEEQARIQAAMKAEALAKAEAEARAAALRAEEQAKVQAALKAESLIKAEAAARDAARATETASRPAAPVVPTSAPTEAAARVPAATSSVTEALLPLAPGSFTNSVGMVFVRLPFGYWVAQTEVTEAQFKKVMGSGVSVAAVGASHPVHEVSVNESLEFCRKLTEIEAKGGWLQKGWRYALPTEGQWQEFVGNARLEDSVTSMPPARRTRPEPVGSTGRPNQYGLYDVRGNVWEWCVASNQQYRGRGGAFNGATLRTLELKATWPSATDRPMALDARRQDIGFRCVMVAAQ